MTLVPYSGDDSEGILGMGSKETKKCAVQLDPSSSTPAALPHASLSVPHADEECQPMKHLLGRMVATHKITVKGKV